jgi:hypothetical protein
VFHLFQFKIHFNLKTDYDNDLFFDTCKTILIKINNNFNHNKRKCFENFEFNVSENESGIVSLHSVLKVMSNTYYILSMGLILSLLVPGFFFIIRYELFSVLISKLARLPSTDSEKNKKIREKKIKIYREKLVKIKQIKLVHSRKFQNLIKENLKLSLSEEKIQKDLSLLQKDLRLYESQNVITSSGDGIEENGIKINKPENSNGKRFKLLLNGVKQNQGIYNGLNKQRLLKK